MRCLCGNNKAPVNGYCPDNENKRKFNQFYQFNQILVSHASGMDWMKLLLNGKRTLRDVAKCRSPSLGQWRVRKKYNKTGRISNGIQSVS